MKHKKQSATFSWIEVAASTAIGFKVALIAQLVLFPLYGIHASMGTQVELTWWFTVISVIRGFAVRRLFEHIHAWRRGRGYE